MARVLALGLAAAVLPACHEHKIQVTNAGANDARVKIHFTTEEEDDDDPVFDRTIHHDDEWIVAPGATGGKTYPPETIDVRIERDTDGSVLLRDTFYWRDFREEHSRIELTVHP